MPTDPKRRSALRNRFFGGRLFTAITVAILTILALAVLALSLAATDPSLSADAETSLLWSEQQ
jgi:hypothetical protein